MDLDRVYSEGRRSDRRTAEAGNHKQAGQDAEAFRWKSHSFFPECQDMGWGRIPTDQILSDTWQWKPCGRHELHADSR